MSPKSRPDIDPYLDTGRRLFPLRKRSKSPLENGWRERIYSPENLRRYVSRGFNLGWAMGPRDVVLDVDPRKQGVDGALARLRAAWPEVDLAPMVWTGGADGGRHYYLRLPEETPRVLTPPDFRPLDFRHFGQYVVTAGSIHPDTGRPYMWDAMTDPGSYGLSIPNWLARDMSSKPSVGTKPGTMIDVLPLPEARHYLSQLNPTDFRDYDRWLEIGMSLHAGTLGSVQAREMWVEWSTSDPEYADADEIARAKWESFEAVSQERARVTVATLIKRVLDSGGTIHEQTADEDFADAPPPRWPKPKSDALGDWLDWIAEIPSTQIDLDKIVKKAVKRYTLGDWIRIRKAIKSAHGVPLKDLDRIRSAAERHEKAVQRRARANAADTPDYGIDVAERALRDVWDEGRTLLHASNQSFYQYTGTHWESIPPNVITRRLVEAAETLRDEGLKLRPSQVEASAHRVLVARSAKFDDVLRLGSTEPPPVVNTENYEVWIPRYGSDPAEARPHVPESYLTTCLGVKYDADGECPLCDQTLDEIFRQNAEPAEMVRHFWEFVGYVIQPEKNIPSWWLMYGDGSNGKTLLMEIVQALLGPAVLPRPLAEFADTNRNNHATAALVGKLMVLDDDTDTSIALPESALKKLAESKVLEANPKNRDAFTFRASATPVALFNGWPKVRDLSWGMLRKTYIIPFRRIFAESEQDISRKRRIFKSEMSGVLNRALEGLARLRRRGRFAEPAECKEAKVEWLRLANPVVDFVHTQTKKDGEILIGDLYEYYRIWGRNQGGVNYPLSLGRFEVAVIQMGHKIEQDGDARVVRGLSMKGDQ